jgi:hypothetical protein
MKFGTMGKNETFGALSIFVITHFEASTKFWENQNYNKWKEKLKSSQKIIF